jgi:hypothetical protein
MSRSTATAIRLEFAPGSASGRRFSNASTTGDADYHPRNHQRHGDFAFLDDFMFKIPGIRHVRTNVILKEIKYDVALPF